MSFLYVALGHEHVEELENSRHGETQTGELSVWGPCSFSAAAYERVDVQVDGTSLPVSQSVYFVGLRLAVFSSMILYNAYAKFVLFATCPHVQPKV